jgi:GR25 family glycosyltransferase involved in LPS biosynthesis
VPSTRPNDNDLSAEAELHAQAALDGAHLDHVDVGNISTAESSGATGQQGLLTYFNNTFFITLRRDEIRVAHVRSQIEHVFTGATVSWAIDARNLSDSQIEQWRSDGYIYTNLRTLLGRQMDPNTRVGRAKIGCLMSHVLLWERLASEPRNDTFYMIMEDDTISAVDFDTRFPKLLAELEDLPWDWVHLHVHPVFADKNTLSIPDKQQLNQATTQYGAQGYLISRRGARKLLKLMLPLSTPNDMALAQLITEKKINAYITKESLVYNLGQLTGTGHGTLYGSNIWR